MSGARRLDVLVVGAGPAGCAAAVTLARAGAGVLVCDKATFPRDKCCGDGLTTGALRRLEALGADPPSAATWRQVGGVSVRSPSGRVARIPFPQRPGVFGAVCRRKELDATLVGAARRAGAAVEEGRPFGTLEATPEGMRVEAGGEELLARYVVAADGVWSPVRRAAGAADAPAAGEEGGYLGEWHAFRQYVAGVGAEAAELLWVWFDDAVLPGYAWSFPLAGGRANVGVTLRRRPGVSGADLAGRFREVLESPWCRSLLGRAATAEGAVRSWPIPTRTSGSPLWAAGGRILFTGDAARLADPLTGEGVGQALESGTAAAAAILAGGDGPPVGVAAAYEQELRQGLLADNRLAGLLSGGLASAVVARAFVRGAGARAARRAAGAWLFEDFPRATLLTPRRWRPGVLRRPGAYAGGSTYNAAPGGRRRGASGGGST